MCANLRGIPVLRWAVSAPPTYWVRYRVTEGDGGYRQKLGKAGTLMALAAQINQIVDEGWTVIAIGATASRPLDEKERSVIATLTRGRVEIP